MVFEGGGLMDKVLFKNARIISGDNIIEEACLLVENGLIKSISDDISCNDDNTLIIDAKNSYLAPGFIDLHFHGIRNIGVSKAGDIEKICRMLPEYGSHGFSAYRYSQRNGDRGYKAAGRYCTDSL